LPSRVRSATGRDRVSDFYLDRKEKNMTTADHDVTSVVLAQHKEVGGRLAAVAKATGAERGTEFASLAALLIAHETAEQAVIYPALRKLGAEGVRIADERTGEEGAAKDTLTKLQAMDTGSAEFETLFGEFSAKVHAHADSEEAQVIPLLTQSTTPEDRRSMGDAFLATQHGVPTAS
jgi:hemerythrin superfamily protein